MEITGKIIKIGELRQVTDSFKLVEWVLKTDEMYPQEIQFQSSQDKADNFLQYHKVGDNVTASFNVRGRSWLKEGEDESKRRWFNTLDAWMVKKAEGGQVDTNEPVSAPATDEAFDDGLPF